MSADSRQQVWDVFAKAIETFDKKNADYGDAWRTNGWRGNLSRIFEKVQRVRNLAWRPDPRVPAVGDEQVLETLQDLLNTTAFAIINLIEEVEYGHEVPRSQRARLFEEQYEPGVASAFYEQVGTELPHKPLDQVHTSEELERLREPGTQRITVNPQDVQAAVVGFQNGPDEVSATEEKHTRVQRKPRQQNTAVRDNPQA